MIIKQHQISIKELSPGSIPYFTEDMVLFDIETTGFSPKTSYLYLVGCVTTKDGILSVTQFLAEKKEEEDQLLDKFFSLCQGFEQCVSFNGDGFDIPYLCDKAKKYHYKNAFSGLTSLDLYKQIKPLQSILKLENLKQKTLECFMGLTRKDMFHGGELIDHYFMYEKSKDPVEEELLLLHNYEDILGLVCLLPLQSYQLAFKGGYKFEKAERTTSRNYYGNTVENLILFASLQESVPKTVSYSKGPYYLVLNSGNLKLSVQVIDNKIYVPYSDYKNYYYLEKEDMAILKELATYVDKMDRKPATPATAYGKFLLTEDNLGKPEIFQPYIKQVLDVLVKWK